MRHGRAWANWGQGRHCKTPEDRHGHHHPDMEHPVGPRRGRPGRPVAHAGRSVRHGAVRRAVPAGGHVGLRPSARPTGRGPVAGTGRSARTGIHPDRRHRTGAPRGRTDPALRQCHRHAAAGAARRAACPALSGRCRPDHAAHGHRGDRAGAIRAAARGQHAPGVLLGNAAHRADRRPARASCGGLHARGPSTHAGAGTHRWPVSSARADTRHRHLRRFQLQAGFQAQAARHRTVLT